MSENRSHDVELELERRGWTSKEHNAHEVFVYSKYNKRKNLVEWTVFAKVPYWEWDFVDNNMDGSFRDYNPSPDKWIYNIRFDMELGPDLEPSVVAELITVQRNREWSWRLPYKNGLHIQAVQRVVDRPKL